MLDRVFPLRADNTFHGHKLALWLFGALVLVKGAIGAGTIFNGRSAATSADGIPLDAFTPAGADAFVSLFAAWGYSHLILNLIGVLVLIRYRGLVPLMFAVLLTEHLGRKLIFWILPIVRTETPPGFYLNLGLVAIMVVGLILSLRRATPN